MSIKLRNIVHVITSLDMGGAERSLANLVLNMDRRQYSNVVLCLKDLGYWGPKLQEQGIEVIALNMHSSIRAIPGLWKIWRILRQRKPDVVQAWMYHANVVAFVIGRMAGIKNIYWNIRCSLMDLSQYGFLTRLMFRCGAFLAKWPRAIINNSQGSIQQHIRQGYINSNWVHIPNGFNTQRFKPNSEIYTRFRAEHNLPQDVLIIGMVARFDPMKDHLTFIRAAGILARMRPDVYFVCAGRGVNTSNQTLHAEIVRANLGTKILLLDQIDAVHDLYPAFDYLTQTSIFGEGFPNVVAEAMACGVPCFVTDVGDSVKIIGDAGYVIAPQQPDALAKMWLAAISSKDAVRLKNVARDRIVQNFSLESTIAAYATCYECVT